MADWKEVQKDYENGMSYADMAQKYNQKANTIKGRKQREHWERKEIDITEPKKVFDIESLKYKKGFSLADIFESYVGRPPDDIEKECRWRIDTELVAKGMGLKNKVTVKYSRDGEILNIASTNILPTQNDKKIADEILREWDRKYINRFLGSR